MRGRQEKQKPPSEEGGFCDGDSRQDTELVVARDDALFLEDVDQRIGLAFKTVETAVNLVETAVNVLELTADFLELTVDVLELRGDILLDDFPHLLADQLDVFGRKHAHMRKE